MGLSLPGKFASKLQQGMSLLSKKFKDTLFGLLIKASFRVTAMDYNRQSCRREDEIVTVSSLTKYVEQEGADLLQKKKEATEHFLASCECFDTDGVLKQDAKLPDAWKSAESDWIHVDAPTVASQLPEESRTKLAALTVNEALQMDQAQLGQLYEEPSAPCSDKIKHKLKRRDSRTELPPECKEPRLTGYAEWLNSQENINWRRKILHQWQIEKDSRQTVRISIDAVLVHEQAKEHIKGGKPAMKEEKTFIKHWDIRIDADDRSYFISSIDESEAYKELLVTLIKNNLIQRHLIFFIDGETRIHKAIKRYFAPWNYAVYLDFHHLEEKIRTYMSLMIVQRRVADPTAEREVYKIGPKAGQPKEAAKTSLSQLYAKEAVCMAWSGNIAELVAYVRLIPDTDIKNEGARSDLLKYIENKQDWITCYRLRKIAGLQNSSNVVEQENQMIVSNRQKDELMSWSENGSANLAALTALYCNNEQDDWYDNHIINFIPWDNSKQKIA